MIKESEENYRSIAASIDDGIIALDLNGLITYANPRACEITGFSPADSKGKPISSILGPVAGREIEKLHKEVLADGKAMVREVEIDSKSGKRIIVELNASVLRNGESKVTGVVAAIRDITVRKIAIEEIKQKNRELRLLSSISSCINSSRDMQGMLFSVLTDTTNLLRLQSGAIYLEDNLRPGQMSLQASLPYAVPEVPERFRQSFIPAIRLETGRVCANDESLSRCILSPPGTGPIITVPITTKSRLNGLLVLCAGSADEARHLCVSERTTAQLLSIASQLGIAVENQMRIGRIMPGSEKARDYDREYSFSKGTIYFMDKRKTDRHMNIFTDQVRHNIRGLCVTRLSPKAVRDRYGLDNTPVVWLNGGDVTYGETAIRPGNITSLTAAIADFIARTEDGVVLLDGMEYLMARNGFEAMLKFVQFLNDRIMTSNSRAFFCIDTGTLDDQQRHLLLTEMTEFKEQA